MKAVVTLGNGGCEKLEYKSVPAGEGYPVDCSWTDAELGTIPCACGTAENMIHRAGLWVHDQGA